MNNNLNENDIKDLPMFFIIGRPRSGTTLLRTLFDAHPKVNIPIECSYIIDLAKHYQSIKVWDTKLLLQFYDDLIVRFRFNNWLVDLEKLKNDLLKCEGINTYSMICKVVHLNYPSVFIKENFLYIGDKNPIYSIYTKKLISIFPEAKFIFIYKDYRDNYVSMVKAKFGIPIVSIHVYQWKTLYKLVNKQALKHPDRFLFLKYEDLVTEPEFYVKKAFDFIGVTYNPVVLDFYKMKDVFNEKYSKAAQGNHNSLLNPINTSRIGLWKNALTRKQLHIADMTAGFLADKLGYIRIYKHFNFFLWIQTLPAILYAKHINFLGYLTDLLPYKIRIKTKEKDSILIKLYMKLFTKKNQG